VKLLLMMSILVFSSEAVAFSKCLIDGKIVYQRGVCLNGEAKRIDAAISDVGSSSIRKEINQRAIQQENARMMELQSIAHGRAKGREAKEQQVQAREVLRQKGAWTSADDQNVKLEEIDRKIRQLQVQQQVDKSNAQIQRIMGR
jgi:hypothetical protein